MFWKKGLDKDKERKLALMVLAECNELMRNASEHIVANNKHSVIRNICKRYNITVPSRDSPFTCDATCDGIRDSFKVLKGMQAEDFNDLTKEKYDQLFTVEVPYFTSAIDSYLTNSDRIDENIAYYIGRVKKMVYELRVFSKHKTNRIYFHRELCQYVYWLIHYMFRTDIVSKEEFDRTIMLTFPYMVGLKDDFIYYFPVQKLTVELCDTCQNSNKLTVFQKKLLQGKKKTVTKKKPVKKKQLKRSLLKR